jgi:hypothetical protein
MSDKDCDCCCDDDCCCDYDDFYDEEDCYYEDTTDYIVGALFTAGFIVFGILMLTVSFEWFGQIVNGMQYDATSLDVVKIALSFICLAFTWLMMRNGFLLEGLIVGLMSVSTLIFGITGLFDGAMGFIWLDVMIGIALALCVYIAFTRRDWAMTVVSAAGMVSYIAYPLIYGFSPSGSSMIVGVLLALAGAAAMIYGAYNLIQQERFHNWLIDSDEEF